MKNIRSNIIAAGILCLSLGMTSCTKGFLVIDVQHVVALSISWLAPK